MGDLAEDPAHYLARTRLGKSRSPLHFVRRGDGADFLAHVAHQFLFEIVTGLNAFLQGYVHIDALALDLVGVAHHGGLGHLRMADQGAFHLGGAHAVARDVDDVVDAAHEPVVAVVVEPGAVTGEVLAGEVIEVDLLHAFALGVAISAAYHARPRKLDAELAALVGFDRLALVIDHQRTHSEERTAGGTGLQGHGPGKRGDEDAAGFGLPPGVHDGQLAPSYMGVIPHPRLGVDGLAHGAQYLQRTEVVFIHPLGALAHEGAYDRGRGVEAVDLVFVAYLPEAARVGVAGDALEHQRGGPCRERPVGYVAVAGYPADVGGAEPYLVLVIVENVAEGHVGIEHVAARGVQHALGFAR